MIENKSMMVPAHEGLIATLAQSLQSACWPLPAMTSVSSFGNKMSPLNRIHTS
jgi:hypothetical protein